MRSHARMRIARPVHISTKNAVLSYKVETRSRDPASWLPLAEGVSSRNLVFTFYLRTVHTQQCKLLSVSESRFLANLSKSQVTTYSYLIYFFFGGLQHAPLTHINFTW